MLRFEIGQWDGVGKIGRTLNLTDRQTPLFIIKMSVKRVVRLKRVKNKSARALVRAQT